MGLESVTYIPELTQTNPIGASDPKSEGDDHLRLIKTALLNTFGAFVGTAGSPASVSLTEAQINDAARKAAIATISALWNFTVDPTLSGDRIGRNKLPQNIQNGNYTFVLADAGKHIYKASGASNTLTIPANASVAYPLGDILTVVNRSGNDVTIAITTDTMELESDGSTGNRTLADKGVANFLKVTTTLWLAMGGPALT